MVLARLAMAVLDAGNYDCRRHIERKYCALKKNAVLLEAAVRVKARLEELH